MKNDWKKLIPQCFCYGERGFVGHPSEEETAFELLAQLRARSIGLATFIAEVGRQLKDMPKLDAATEMRTVRARFEPWLLD